MARKVVVTDYNFPDLQHEAAAARAEGASFEPMQVTTSDDAARALEGADVGIVQFAGIDARAIQGMNPGAVLIRYGVGYDNIDIDAARAQGVRVAYVPDYCTNEVADHTVALLLAALRKLPQLDRTTRDGTWAPVAQAAPILPFPDTVIGFLGYGRIAAAVRARLAAFGFTVIVADPYLDTDTAAREGVELVGTADLAGRADALTLHAPSTPRTRHIINAGFLDRMKPGAVLVNTSRGDLIDTHALARALVSGTPALAALDVFEAEPLASDHPLRSAPNLLLSPHIAWYSTASIDRLQRLVADEIGRALRGEPLRCPVIDT